MKRTLTTLLVTGTVLASAMGVAVADEPQRVIVVELDVHDVAPGLMDEVYSQLRSTIAEDPGLEVAETGDISMGDLLMLTGCAEPTPDCLAMASDFVDGDQIIFGMVSQRDDRLGFDLSRYDFASGAMIREIEDQSVRGDDAWLRSGIAGVVDHIVHGPTATVSVTVSDAQDAQIRVNGAAVGSGSVVVEDVAPGEVIVMAMDGDGSEAQERLIVRHQEQAEITLTLGDEVIEIEDPGPVVIKPSLIPGLAVTGAGVGALVFGFMQHSSFNSSEAEGLSFWGDGTYLTDSNDIAAYEDIMDSNRRHNMLRRTGWGLGAVGVAAGGFLLFRALTADPIYLDDHPASASSRPVDLDFGASSDGVNAGLRISF